MNPIVQEFIELDVSSTTLPKLTPYATVLALLVEFQILEQSDNDFEKTVYDGLTHVPINGGHTKLNLHELVADLYRLFQANKDKEFACATFDSLYRTWVKGQFNRDHNLTTVEGALRVDEANFMQLFKLLIFLSSEMYKRFFMDYNPHVTDTSKAYYTIFTDASKKQRTSSTFFQFLNDFRPLYIRLCMISPDKAEIRKIYKEAGEHAKAMSEKARAERFASYNKDSKDSKGYKEGAQKYIRARLEKKAAQAESAPKPAVFFPSAPTAPVWNKKVPAAAAAVDDAPVQEVKVSAEVETSDDEFKLVVTKKQTPRKFLGGASKRQ